MFVSGQGICMAISMIITHNPIGRHKGETKPSITRLDRNFFSIPLFFLLNTEAGAIISEDIH